MSIDIGGLIYNTPNDFIKRYIELSRVDGKHDGFINKEFNYYFPRQFEQIIPESQGIPSEDQIMNEIFGPYQGPLEDTNALIDTALVNGTQVQLIPTAHGLSKILGEMGYKYSSLKRNNENLSAAGASLALKLLTMGVPQGSNIYLFVDHPKGIYDILNTIDNSQYNFTVVFNRATITDPAPNAIAVLNSKKNSFKFALDGGLKSNIVDGRNLKFAIEDPESDVGKYSGYLNLSEILQDIDSNKIKNTLDRTLVSKYDISLTYAQSSKYKVDNTGKGVDPKKLKAGLTIIDKENGRVRILDSKLCEKKNKHTGNTNWATSLKNKLYEMYNTWLGDSTGGTHALGKKCGDWLQAQRVFDNNLNIRILERVEKGSMLSKSKWFYSPTMNIGDTNLKSVNTHDRIEKVYSLTIGSPIVIFANAGSGGMPQFYEIYVKNYLLQVSQEEYTKKIQLYKETVVLYRNKYNEFVSKRDEFNTNLNNLQNGSLNIINNLNFQINNIDDLIINNILNIGSDNENIDLTYKKFINSLFAIKIVLNISNLDNYEEPINTQSPKINIPIAPFSQNNNQNKINFNTLTNKIQFINKNIDNINFSINKLSNNITLITDILSGLDNNINEDLNHIALFKFKVNKTDSMFQRQIFLHENIGYVYLNGIIDTYNSMQKLPDIFNNLKETYLNKINNLGSTIETFLNYIDTNNNLITNNIESNRQTYSTFQQVTIRRMNPSVYLSYVMNNLKELLNILTKNELVGGARPKNAPKPASIPSQAIQQGESKKSMVQSASEMKTNMVAMKNLLNDVESVLNDEIFLLEIQAEVPNPRNELIRKIIEKNYDLQQIMEENITTINSVLLGSPSVKYASIADIKYIKKLQNENKIINEFTQNSSKDMQKIKVCVNNVDVYLADIDDSAEGKKYIESLNNYIYGVEDETDKNSNNMLQEQAKEKTILNTLQQYGLNNIQQNQVLNFALTYNINIPTSYQALSIASKQNMNPVDVLKRLTQKQGNYNLRNVPGRNIGYYKNIQEQKMDGGNKKRKKSKKRRKPKKRTRKKLLKQALLKNKKLLQKALSKIKKIRKRQEKRKTKKNRKNKNKTKNKYIKKNKN